MPVLFLDVVLFMLLFISFSVLIQLIQIHVKESDVIQMQIVSSSFLASGDCVFVRKVGKETDEPVLVCGLEKLSICRENPVGNQMLFHLIHRWLDGRKMLIFTCLLFKDELFTFIIRASWSLGVQTD